MERQKLEEAHNELEELQKQMTTYRRAYSEKYIKANGIAIECIEKRIPKKSIVKNDVPNYCPSCNTWNGWDGHRWCIGCGQRLE